MALRALFGRDAGSRRTLARAPVTVFFKLLLQPLPVAGLAQAE
jgi:hypothetical protein